MIDIIFENQFGSVKTIINKTKYYITKNIKDYWIIKKSVNSNLNRVGSSDYSEENNNKTFIKIDGNDISKFDELVFIDDNYDLEDDSKLGSKSLMLKYILKLINENIMSDEFLQLNCMLELFTNMLSNNLFEVEAIKLSAKTLVKQIAISVLKEGFSCNSNDLTYEETIIIQLELLKNIITKEKRYIVVIDLIVLTERLYDEIELLENCYVLIIFHSSEKNDFCDNIMIDGIDFEDDEILYERMMNMSDFYNLDEYKINKKEEYLKKLK